MCLCMHVQVGKLKGQLVGNGCCLPCGFWVLNSGSVEHKASLGKTPHPPPPKTSAFILREFGRMTFVFTWN